MNATACPCGRNARRTTPAGPRCLACAAEELRRPGPRPDLAELLSPREARALSALRGGRMPATGREATRADVAALAALGLIGEATKARADWLLDVVPAVAPRGWVPPLLALARAPEPPPPPPPPTPPTPPPPPRRNPRWTSAGPPIVPVLPAGPPAPRREVSGGADVEAALRAGHTTARAISAALGIAPQAIGYALNEVGVVVGVRNEMSTWRLRRPGEHRTCDVIRATVEANPGRMPADIAAALKVTPCSVRHAMHVIAKGHTR